MRTRFKLVPGLLLPLLLAGTAQALTLPELAHREKLTPPPQLANTYGTIESASGQQDFVLSAWQKDGRWGVISEQRSTRTRQANWLAKPNHEAVLVPRFTRTQGHVWLKPEGAAHWQVFHTNGKKLNARGNTPYSEMRTLREGPDTRPQAHRHDPSQDPRPHYRDLIMGIHAGHDPASADIDLIDVGENRVLLTIRQIDTREEPLLDKRMLLLRHDHRADGHTLVRLPPPPAATQAHAPLEASAFYWNLVLEGPVASARDYDGTTVILDQTLRPVAFPGLTLGQPTPLHPAWNEPYRVYKVQVSTVDGRAGYQFIYRGSDGNPVLDPTLWQDILQVQGYIVVVLNNQWQLMTARPGGSGPVIQPRLLDGQMVTATTPEALYAAVARVQQADLRQATLDARHAAEQRARWQAEYAEQQRQEAADRAELQRRIDAHAQARVAAQAEYQRQKAQSAAEFSARNKSSWGNLQPLSLPTASGASSLSTLERDHYDNRGNARNPYVIREQPRQ